MTVCPASFATRLAFSDYGVDGSGKELLDLDLHVRFEQRVAKMARAKRARVAHAARSRTALRLLQRERPASYCNGRRKTLHVAA